MLTKLIAYSAVIAAFGYCLAIIINTPVVEVSHETATCVRVLPPEAGSCEDLPARYELVWVK